MSEFEQDHLWPWRDNLSTADVIALMLAEADCEQAFGIPGGEVLTLIDALERAGIRFVLVKHENAGGFMAEGAWHASGAPGVLVATIGPGLANAVNVVANALQDRVPLIVLAGCVDEAEAETYTHQVFDHRALLGPITKATFRAHPETIATVMAKALTVALSGQPGPVLVDVPVAVAGAPARADRRRSSRASVPAQPAATADLGSVRGALIAAERPLVIAGIDAVNADAGRALREFLDATGAVLVTTYKGKGLVDEDDARAVGAAGLSPLADRHILPLVRRADVVVLAGYDPIEMRSGWRDPWPEEARVYDVTPVVRTHGMHAALLTLLGSVPETLAAMRPLPGGAPVPMRWAGGEPEAVRAGLRAAFAPEPSRWGPAAAVHALREALPDETVVTVDSGAHRILLSQVWTCHAPRTLLQSTALCTMGCAVPLAAGHRLARPRTPVVAVVGDGGLEMGLGELATIRDLGLTLPVVVLVDGSLGLIELKQRGSQLRNVGVDFPGTDFPAVAAALGGHGVWIDDADALRREAGAALSRPGFTLLAVRIGRRAYDGKF